MSYRNDHDAALNRVDALERELAQLREEKNREGKRIQPEKRRPKRLGTLVGVGVGTILCAVGFLAKAGTHEKPVVINDDEPGDVAVLRAPIVPMDESACMEEIEQRAAEDARAADPRGGSPKAVAALMRGSVGCKLPTYGRPTGELENVSSLITVYYEGNPVALDNYGSAEQLWREYHRARARS